MKHSRIWTLLQVTFSVMLVFSALKVEADEARKTVPEACKAVKKLAVPEDQMPSMKDRDKLQKCSSEALYYGIGLPIDALMARHCAVIENESRSELVFSGDAILMMIYANGNGAKQDYDLALHFACEVDGAPAEVEGRVEHLVKLKKEANTKPAFDFCDDITSGFMMGHCAAHRARLAKPNAEKAAQQLRESLSPSERHAYDSLRSVASNYFFSRSREEVDLSGSARGMFIAEEEQALEKEFADSLVKVANAGGIAEAGKTESEAADRRLNETYAKLKNVKNIDGGTVTFDGIKKTQKLWLKYRDAWVAYAAAKTPTLSKSAVLKWQTELRLKKLEEFAVSVGVKK